MLKKPEALDRKSGADKRCKSASNTNQTFYIRASFLFKKFKKTIYFDDLFPYEDLDEIEKRFKDFLDEATDMRIKLILASRNKKD